MTPAERHSRLVWLAVPAVAAVAWAATSLRPFTIPALVVTLAAGGAALAAGRRLAPLREPEDAGRGARTASPAGLGWWAAAAAALAALELAAFLQLPRSAYPTLSSLANAVFDSHVVRWAAFVVWLAAGVGIARR